MNEKIRILFLSANPWTTSRILVDEEAREVFEKLQEGTYRERFEFHKHAAIRTTDLQRFLMMYKPHIVHFSGHGSKSHKIILGSTPGRGKEVDRQGLVEIFALYQKHVRLAFLNACFTTSQARSLSEVIDYAVGAGKMIGDKGGVAFAGAFYRALGFGMSVKEAFESAQAEIALTKMPRTKGFELFVRHGVDEDDLFPQLGSALDREAAEPSRFVSYPLSNNGHKQSCGGTLFCEDLVLKSTKSAVAEIGRCETSDLRPAAKSASSNLRKDEIARRSATSYSCVYVVLTVRVRRVLLMGPRPSLKKMARAAPARALRTRSGREQ